LQLFDHDPRISRAWGRLFPTELITLDRTAQAPLNSDRLPSMPARWEEYGGATEGCCEQEIFAYSGRPVVSPPPAVDAL